MDGHTPDYSNDLYVRCGVEKMSMDVYGCMFDVYDVRV